MSFDHLNSIYRSYDIRGAYPEEINANEVRAIGRALVDLYQAKRVVIGHDYRPSSEELHQALLEGLTQQGADVTTVGMVTTPMLYFAAGSLATDVSVMVSGSHMPAGFNGLKICVGGVVPIGLDSGLAEVRDYVEADTFVAGAQSGTITTTDIKPAWRKHIASHCQLDENVPMKIVVDPANMVGIEEIETLKAIPGIELETLFAEYDWSCPNHEANPIKFDTLEPLAKEVLETNAVMGIALDGDADRIGIVDERGTPVPQDMVGVLLAKELLSLNKNPGKVIYDVRSSKRILEVVEAAGGQALPCRIGHTHLRRMMRESNALYALELSGHHFFKENYNSEGGVYAAVLLLQVMQKSGQKLSDLVAAEQIYFHSTEINSEVTRRPEEIYTGLKAAFPDAVFEEIDGLTIKYKDWWCNVRPSANDPVMRLNLEADTKERMEEMRDKILAIIRSHI